MRYVQNDLVQLFTQIANITVIAVPLLLMAAAAVFMFGVILEIKWKREEMKINGGTRQKTQAHRIEDTGGESGQAPDKRKRTQAAKGKNTEMPGMA